jgi:phthalate 4,5-dioxygenase oxygenase subunit
MHRGLSIHIMEFAPATSAPYEDIRPAPNKHNDYLIDWEVQRQRKYFGVPGVGAQDKAITESQQPIVDRTQERLGRADLGVIRVRKWLLDAVVALQDRGTLPPGMDATSFRIRPASVLLPKDVPWVEGSQERLVARRTSPTSLA